jgi:hypothetical protein
MSIVGKSTWPEMTGQDSPQPANRDHVLLGLHCWASEPLVAGLISDKANVVDDNVDPGESKRAIIQ